MELITFILTAAGLVMILNMSKLFKPLRDAITMAYLRSIKRKTIMFPYWFLNSIFECALCMGVWASLVVFLVNQYAPKVVSLGLGYVCIGSCCSLFVMSIYQLIERK